MHAPVAMAAQVQILPDNLLLDLEAAFSLDLNLAAGQMSFENVALTANGTQQGRSFHVQLNSPLAQITEEKLYAKTADIQITGDQSLGDIALSAAELQIEELAWQAPDLYLRYTKGSGNQALKLDLRSPVVFDREKALYLAEHIQGTVTLPGQTETIPVSGKISTDWNNEQIQGEFFARVHGAHGGAVCLRHRLVQYAHPLSGRGNGALCPGSFYVPRARVRCGALRGHGSLEQARRQRQKGLSRIKGGA